MLLTPNNHRLRSEVTTALSSLLLHDLQTAYSLEVLQICYFCTLFKEKLHLCTIRDHTAQSCQSQEIVSPLLPNCFIIQTERWHTQTPSAEHISYSSTYTRISAYFIIEQELNNEHTNLNMSIIG